LESVELGISIRGEGSVGTFGATMRHYYKTAETVRATGGKTPGDSSVNYNLQDMVTTYLQKIPQRIR